MERVLLNILMILGIFVGNFYKYLHLWLYLWPRVTYGSRNSTLNLRGNTYYIFLNNPTKKHDFNENAQVCR